MLLLLPAAAPSRFCRWCCRVLLLIRPHIFRTSSSCNIHASLAVRQIGRQPSTDRSNLAATGAEQPLSAPFHRQTDRTRARVCCCGRRNPIQPVLINSELRRSRARQRDCDGSYNRIEDLPEQKLTFQIFTRVISIQMERILNLDIISNCHSLD